MPISKPTLVSLIHLRGRSIAAPKIAIKCQTFTTATHSTGGAL